MKSFSSFQRQLRRVGGLSRHELFVRDNPAKARRMRRTKIKWWPPKSRKKEATTDYILREKQAITKLVPPSNIWTRVMTIVKKMLAVAISLWIIRVYLWLCACLLLVEYYSEESRGRTVQNIYRTVSKSFSWEQFRKNCLRSLQFIHQYY